MPPYGIGDVLPAVLLKDTRIRCRMTGVLWIIMPRACSGRADIVSAIFAGIITKKTQYDHANYLITIA